MRFVTASFLRIWLTCDLTVFCEITKRSAISEFFAPVAIISMTSSSRRLSTSRRGTICGLAVRSQSISFALPRTARRSSGASNCSRADEHGCQRHVSERAVCDVLHHVDGDRKCQGERGRDEADRHAEVSRDDPDREDEQVPQRLARIDRDARIATPDVMTATPTASMRLMPRVRLPNAADPASLDFRGHPSSLRLELVTELASRSLLLHFGPGCGVSSQYPPIGVRPGSSG